MFTKYLCYYHDIRLGFLLNYMQFQVLFLLFLKSNSMIENVFQSSGEVWRINFLFQILYIYMAQYLHCKII